MAVRRVLAVADLVRQALGEECAPLGDVVTGNGEGGQGTGNTGRDEVKLDVW